MSTVLAVIEPAEPGGKPLLLVLCATCGSQREVRCDKAQAARVNRCRWCRNFVSSKPRPRKYPVTPCAVCGEPATHQSAFHARHRGHLAYCAEHRARRLATARAARQRRASA